MSDFDDEAIDVRSIRVIAWISCTLQISVARRVGEELARKSRDWNIARLFSFKTNQYQRLLERAAALRAEAQREELGEANANGGGQ